MRKRILLVAALAAIFTQPCFAATSTANTKSTATVTATCQISGTNLNFGQIGTTPSGYTTTSSTVTVLCSKNASYSFTVGFGSNSPYWYQTLAMYMVAPTGGSMAYMVCADASTPISNIGVGAYGSGSINPKCNGYQMGVSTLMDSITSKGTGTYQTWNLNGAVQNGYSYNPGSYSDTNTLDIRF